jgi:hypothetical protein
MKIHHQSRMKRTALSALGARMRTRMRPAVSLRRPGRNRAFIPIQQA